MKKTQIAELFANLAATIVSFFSIVMFVALGVGVFLGLRWSSAALTTTVQGICERQAAPDIEISYPYGLDSEDIEAIREAEGVEDVECGYVTFAETSINGIANSLRIQSLTGAAPRLPPMIIRTGFFSVKPHRAIPFSGSPW